MSIALPEATRLESCERVLERGLGSFVEVGEALAEIRDSGLYRVTHATFRAYCRDRWGLGETHARQLINAYQVVDALASTESNGNEQAANEMRATARISSERQARELNPLKEAPKKMAAAWSEAVTKSNGKPTAAAVREAVKNQMGAPTPTRRQRIPPAQLIEALNHAARAAKTAEGVRREQLVNRAAEVATWRDNLGASLQALQRLHQLLQEVTP